MRSKNTFTTINALQNKKERKKQQIPFMVVEQPRLYILQIRNIPSGKRMFTFLVLGNDKNAWLNCSSQTPRKCCRHYSGKNSQCCSVLYGPLHRDTSVTGRFNWNSKQTNLVWNQFFLLTDTLSKYQTKSDPSTQMLWQTRSNGWKLLYTQLKNISSQTHTYTTFRRCRWRSLRSWCTCRVKCP